MRQILVVFGQECCLDAVGFPARPETMSVRPRGLSIHFGIKETAQMRKFAPLAASLALFVASLFTADLATYWP
jgi:hypothetical protein